MNNLDRSPSSSSEEDQGLLSRKSSQDHEQIAYLPHHENESLTLPLSQTLQSPRSPLTSLSPQTSRSPSRVRFDLSPIENGVNTVCASPPPPYNNDPSESGHDGENDSHSQNIPLLHSINESYPPSQDAPWGNEDVLTWAEREQQRPKSGMRSAFMNMTNSILGAGIIGQPYAFRQAGLLSGIILLIMLTVMVDWTIGLIVINSKLSGSTSLQGTMKHCFGRTGLIIISLGQWAFAFGGMVAFGIIVGDTIPHVFLALWPGIVNVSVLNFLISRRVVITVFVSLISYPLSLYRDISKLSKASTLAFISMMIILIAVVSQAPIVPAESRGTLDDSFFMVKGGFFQAISVISFALVCQHNSLLIYDSLKTPTLDRFARVTHYSTGVSMLACLLMALSGYITFGSLTQGNVLNNFPPDNILINLARLCFGLNMLTTLPLEAFVCREVMLNYWLAGEPFNIFIHISFTTFLVFSAMMFSLITCDLGVVFELIGAISACGLAYILPPLCYLKLSTRSWKTIPALACIIFGFLTMIISLSQTFIKLLRHENKSVSCR
ncbi:putative transmembrane amino acid transporter [Erysiphe necator]|uniref:Putative transmembrane amino acid transporter n=1 Tax=Uncinula necator TaxID=52586 RepID=A0A0B1P9G7_UNCNE|nr:putative transmembrane amino acid transporter [Erysiphe necator]